MLRLVSLLVVAALFFLAAGSPYANNMPSVPPAPAEQPAAGTPPPVTPQPPPLPPQEVAEWYYVTGGQALGPMTLTQIQALVAQGLIDGNTSVWKDGMAGWARLADVPELAGMLAGTQRGGNAPPPVVDSQKLLDEKIRAFIAGTWRYEGYVTQGSITAYAVLEITYRPDGTYAGMQSLQFQPMGNVQAPPQTTNRQGRYTVTASDETRFVLVATEYTGVRSQISLVILDGNTVEDTDSGNRSHRVR